MANKRPYLNANSAEDDVDELLAYKQSATGISHLANASYSYSGTGSFQSGSETGSESGSGSDPESDDEDEPKLKYERIGSDIRNEIKQDLVSCMAVHSKFLAIGTHEGLVIISDHEGNLIKSKEFPVHQCTVNDISIDVAGEYVASCSDDGKVVISGLYSSEYNQIVDIERPVKSVALKPDYFKSTNRAFVTGNDKLMLVEKGWMRRNVTPIHEGEGTINIIRWNLNFISWANESAVIVYDLNSKMRITHITRDKKGPRPQLAPCKIVWQGATQFLVGWAFSVKICVVKDKPNSKDTPNKFVEIMGMVEFEDLVAGLGPCPKQPEHIVVLTYNSGNSSKKNQSDDMVPGPASNDDQAQPPHLMVLRINGFDHPEEVSLDVIKVKNFQVYRCNDYRLESVPEEDRFYIVCPHDIILGRKRDVDDHVDWLFQKRHYERAMEVAREQSKLMKRWSLLNIGQECINFMLKEHHYQKAAELCPELYMDNKDLWEDQIYNFIQIGKLEVISPLIPTSHPVLNPAMYELVLNQFLKSDCPTFYQLLKVWPSDIYSSQNIISVIESKMEDEDAPLVESTKNVLLSCLALLYSNKKQFDKALSILLDLGDKYVFELIYKHDLYIAVSSKISSLLELDRIRGVQMLVDQEEVIHPDKVVEQLEAESRMDLLHVYLDALFEKNPQKHTKFHEKQVLLYANYDRAKLLNFLRRSTPNIPLPRALQVCKDKGFTEEQVYLLGRMGNNKDALHLITNRLENIKKAIEFCKEADDPDLWEDLIKYSLKRPEFIKVLLENMGQHVDPYNVIQRIPEGQQIPGLRDALVTILQDFQLLIELNKGCKEILTKDSNSLLDKLTRLKKKAMQVQENRQCALCNGYVLGSVALNSAGSRRDLVVFNCSHVYHESCLRNDRDKEDSAYYCSFCQHATTKSGKTPQAQYNYLIK